MSSGQTLGQAKFNRTIAGALPSQTVFRLDSARNRKVRKEKEKRMGWFKKKFAQWTREAWENSHSDVQDSPIRSHESISGKSSVRFTIYPASGGFVIEHYKQDRYHEHDGPTLTIVNSSDDIGKTVEHILAIEALKRNG
jgi:hypothetical protein